MERTLKIDAALLATLLVSLFLLGSQDFPSARAQAQSAEVTVTSFVMSSPVCAARQAALSALYSKDGNASGLPADCIDKCSDTGNIYLVPLFYADYKDHSPWPHYKVDNPAALKGMCGEKVTVTGHVIGPVPGGYGQLIFHVDSLDAHVKVTN